MTGWLAEADYRLVQRSVPLACVDILCLRGSDLPPQQVGLILRDVTDGTRRWGLVGGRVLRGESLVDAVIRQLRITLGPEVRPGNALEPNPTWIAEYRPDGGDGFLVDPRQHAIGLTYAVVLEGRPQPQEEAYEFRWFGIDELPDQDASAFGQSVVVNRVLERLASTGLTTLR